MERPSRSQRLDALQRLWTPWRMAYIRGDDAGPEGCLFCLLPARERELDPDSLIVHRAQLAYVILNAYPYNPGHLMIVPYRHFDDYEAMESPELHEVAELSQRAVAVLREASQPEAFNIGFNLGVAAGAGIADHVHQHVIPRWGGDTNFITVVGQTRVLPELLEETYERLAPLFAREGV